MDTIAFRRCEMDASEREIRLNVCNIVADGVRPNRTRPRP